MAVQGFLHQNGVFCFGKLVAQTKLPATNGAQKGSSGRYSMIVFYDPGYQPAPALPVLPPVKPVQSDPHSRSTVKS